ncbi:uncharacterized protein LOC121333280, partial [Onychostruthus taczanowskii]|uniref:uncharacterized protein LOC121333280 n=1 Tax=Onychostruthus taczanowskii TaxID=356909 RepID=UPI001B8055BE
MKPFELCWVSVGCDQQYPSERDAFLRQRTLKFAILGGSPNSNKSWSDAPAPRGLILHMSGNAKASESLPVRPALRSPRPQRQERKEGWRKEDATLVTEGWVRDQLERPNTHKSMGSDGMHPWEPRELADVDKPTSIICAKAWRTGEVPDDWSKVNITAISKKDKKEDLGRYALSAGEGITLPEPLGRRAQGASGRRRAAQGGAHAAPLCPAQPSALLSRRHQRDGEGLGGEGRDLSCAPPRPPPAATLLCRGRREQREATKGSRPSARGARSRRHGEFVNPCERHIGSLWSADFSSSVEFSAQTLNLQWQNVSLTFFDLQIRKEKPPSESVAEEDDLQEAVPSLFSGCFSCGLSLDAALAYTGFVPRSGWVVEDVVGRQVSILAVILRICSFLEMVGLGNSCRGMKSPPLLMAALVACIIVLGFNYWAASSRSMDLQGQVMDLEGKVRRAAAERGAVEQKKNEFQGELEKQRQQIDKIQSLHSFQMENANRVHQEEK